MVAPGVNRAVLTVRQSLPVFPDKRTFSESVGMSKTCTKADARDCDTAAIAF